MVKRIISIVLFSILSCAAFAQVKVAILPAIDKTGEVKYSHKLMLTSSITTAISMTEGYEAYDRIDLSSILDEQAFQRSGFVSDSEIHRIGEITGASYVLITESAYLDVNSLLATAKIVNVESAKIVNSATAVIKLNDSDIILDECKVLSNKLLDTIGDNAFDSSIKKSYIILYHHNENKTIVSSPYRITCPEGILSDDARLALSAFARERMDDGYVSIIGTGDLCKRAYSHLTTACGIPSYAMSISSQNPFLGKRTQSLISERYNLYDDGLFEENKMSDLEYFIENSRAKDAHRILVMVDVNKKTGSAKSNLMMVVEAKRKIADLLSKHNVPTSIIEYYEAEPNLQYPTKYYVYIIIKH